MSTNYGVVPERFGIRNLEEMERLREKEIVRSLRSPITSRIDTKSREWQAIEYEIRTLIDGDYIMVLRRKGIEHGETEYARGAIDALERLLALAEK